jgi:hypothetical protein
VPNTYIQIGSTVTVGSGGAATIDFSSIPSTYTDLILKISARGTTTSPDRDALLSNIKFNNTSSTYTSKWVRTQGTAASSFNGGALAGYVNASNWTASTFSNTDIYIPNYAGSNQKSYSIDNSAEQNVASYDAMLGLGAGLWNGTGAINQITITLDYGNFAQYSTASLYGVLKS